MDYIENKACCFTCKNNRNCMRKDYECNCEFENRKDNIRQDMCCCDYEVLEGDYNK